MWPDSIRTHDNGRLAKLSRALSNDAVRPTISGAAHSEDGELLQWSFQLPDSKPQFQTLSLPDLLGDEQQAASWTENDGSRWTALFFKWAAGPPRSRILARLHRPENCFPAAGYKLQTDRGIITVRAKDLMIPFHAMDFECDGRQAYVFFCIWQDRLKSSEQLRMRDHWDDRLVGLESVLLGERNLAQQTLEIVVFGYSSLRKPKTHCVAKWMS